jgi:hypothetical protein
METADDILVLPNAALRDQDEIQVARHGRGNQMLKANMASLKAFVGSTSGGGDVKLVPGSDEGDIPSLQVTEFVGESEYGTGVVGNPRGNGAVDFTQVHLTPEGVPSGAYAFQASLGAEASGDYSLAIGGGGASVFAIARSLGSVAISGTVEAGCNYSVAIGSGSLVDNGGGMALGGHAEQGGFAFGGGHAIGGVTIGGFTRGGIAIGPTSVSMITDSLAIGPRSIAFTTKSKAFGGGFAVGQGSLMLGLGLNSINGAATGTSSQTFGLATTYPIMQGDIVDNIFTVSGDYFWSDAVALDSLYKIGDAVILLNASYSSDLESTVVNQAIVTDVTATTLTLNNPPSEGDLSYLLFPSDNSGSSKGKGQKVFGLSAFATLGDAQTSEWLLMQKTSDATPTRLTVDDPPSSPNDKNQIFILNGSVRAVVVDCVGMKDDGTVCRKSIAATIKNVAGTVSLVGSATVEASHVDGAASAWVVAVTADNTDKLLAVTVTGAAASNIRWVANVRSTEVAWFPAAV